MKLARKMKKKFFIDIENLKVTNFKTCYWTDNLIIIFISPTCAKVNLCRVILLLAGYFV